MSILFESDDGWIISHLDYLHSTYEVVQDDQKSVKLKFNEKFFNVNSRYSRQSQTHECKNEADVLETSSCKKNKRKRGRNLPQTILEQNNFIKATGEKLVEAARSFDLFKDTIEQDNNEESRLESKNFYSATLDPIGIYRGGNEEEQGIIAKFQNEKYVFPRHCQFFCKDVEQMNEELDSIGDFDLILMDPPWWNKSIRRKKSKFPDSSYKMMHDSELSKIPIKNLLNCNGIVAVWCTNSSSNETSILEELFPTWGLTFRAKWVWLKVTQNGYPICDFNDKHGKQPYEQIIFGAAESNKNINLPDRKILISVPSAAHSHKPPLTEVLRAYLPKNPKCMELFARYLLPEWTSWGLEVLKFQHLSLYSLVESESNTGDAVESDKR